MSKGALAKQEIGEKILKTFENSFYYNSGKEIRIPWEEEGVLLQIKISMTCAKDMVSINGDIENAATAKEEGPINSFPEPHKPAEPTPEEKKNVEDLLAALGLT